MKLYREVIIETAEQVETLAEAAFLVDSIDGQVYFDAPEGSSYEGEFVDADGNVVFASDLVRCTAYIPVETEETIGVEMDWGVPDMPHNVHITYAMDLDNALWMVENNPKYATGRLMKRYRTDWEEA